MSLLFDPAGDTIKRIHAQYLDFEQRKRFALKDYTPGLFAADDLSEITLSSIVDTIFWSSLRSNEGRSTRVCVTYVSPGNCNSAIAFVMPIQFDPTQITRLAPAIPETGCLVVFAGINGLQIWGYCSKRPSIYMRSVTVEAIDPGIVQVGVGKATRFAVLTGQSAYYLGGDGTQFEKYLETIITNRQPIEGDNTVDRLQLICKSYGELVSLILADGHGGTIIIVPENDYSWSESINPFPYRYAAPNVEEQISLKTNLDMLLFEEKLMKDIEDKGIPGEIKIGMELVIGYRQENAWEGMDRIALNAASLARVDGAVVMSYSYAVLGFGAKLTAGMPPDAAIKIVRPQSGVGAMKNATMEELGGTRHQSAACFAALNKKTMALVVSQDRHLSIMHWDEDMDSVKVIRNAEWWLS